jgi:hypothetical protein
MCHNIRRRSYLTLVLLAIALPLQAADETPEGEIAPDEAAAENGAADDEAGDEIEAKEIFVDDSLDRTPQDCVTTGRIRETDVIDDRTIVFWMRGGQVFSNILERACPGLGRHKRFMHETRGGRLCEIDTITVLEQWAGSISRGFTCGLGQFHPITALEAEDLVLGPDAAASRSDVEVKEVELPPEDRAPADETQEQPPDD